MTYIQARRLLNGTPSRPTDRALAGAMSVLAVGYVVVLGTMLGLIVAASPPAELTGHVEDLRRNFISYRMGFVTASLLAPVLLSLIVVLLGVRGRDDISVRDGLGVAFLVVYVGLSSVAYTTQYTVLPRLLERDEAQAATWYFHDVDSIPYTLDLLGYTMFGIAAVLLAGGFIASRGPWRWAGIVLAASGIGSIAAFACYAAGIDTLASTFTIMSAALTVPLAAIAFVISRQLASRRS